MKDRVAAAFGAFGAAALASVAACNAISGAGSLEACEGPDCPGAPLPSPDRDAAGSAPDGAPAASCNEGDERCTGTNAESCAGGTWQSTPCPEACNGGVCVPFPSCAGDAGASDCGTPPTSCCATIGVPGGTYDRNDDTSLPATVSPFALDRFEVTVGRFRAFVEAGGGLRGTSAPATGSGAHPKIANSGWQQDWNALLPDGTADLRSILAGGTWTDKPGDDEQKPITNVSWFEAFAFCAWDGARLPTYAEWGYVAAGGAEQRVYPWSTPPTSTTLDTRHAAYDCAVSDPAYSCNTITTCSGGAANGMSPCDSATCLAGGGACQPSTTCTGCSNPADVANVGSFAIGAGKWGHLDLAGNAAEWVLDVAGQKGSMVLPTPCTDCANLMPASPGSIETRVVFRGGSWDATPATTTSLQNTSSSSTTRYTERSASIGFRCARDR